MNTIISCPNCQRKLRLREDCSGKEVQCPACLAQFSVPLSDSHPLPELPFPRAALPEGSFAPDNEDEVKRPERSAWPRSHPPQRWRRQEADEPEGPQPWLRRTKRGKTLVGLVIAALLISLGVGGWSGSLARRPRRRDPPAGEDCLDIRG